jgi:hypothetical protein
MTISDKISVEQWVRDILKDLRDLVESNDKRYEQRWVSQERAIEKQSEAQNQYNLSHNNLLADNRKQSDAFSAQIVVLTQQLSAHKEIPIHPGAQSQLDSMRQELKEVKEKQMRLDERGIEKRENTNDNRWTFQTAVSLIFSLLAATISLIVLVKNW